MSKNKDTEKDTEKRPNKVPGSNPSPVGTQTNPVSDPQREAMEEPNPVEKELEARRKFQQERDAENPGD